MLAKQPQKNTYREYLDALWEYLHRPKTLFDLKDRFKCALLLTFIIILLQMVVRWLGY